MEQEKEQIIAADANNQNIDKKWLLIPFIGFCVLAVFCAFIIFQNVFNQLNGAWGFLLFLIILPAVILSVVMFLAIIAHHSSSSVSNTASAVAASGSNKINKIYTLEWVLTIAVFIFFYLLLSFLGSITNVSDRIALLMWMLAFFSPLIIVLLFKTFHLNVRKISYALIIIFTLAIFGVSIWSIFH